MKKIFLCAFLALVFGGSIQAQDSTNTTAPIAPTVVNNLPPRGVTTGGQYFVEEKVVKDNGGGFANFMGDFNDWNTETGTSFLSHYAGKDYYVFDLGNNISGSKEFCIRIGKSFLPEKAIIRGTEDVNSSEIVDNYNKDGHNYYIDATDYGVVFTPK